MCDLGNDCLAIPGAPHCFEKRRKSRHIIDLSGNFRAIKVRSKANVVLARVPDQVIQMAKRCVQAFFAGPTAVSAEETIGEVETDHAAGLTNGPELIVREVAR